MNFDSARLIIPIVFIGSVSIPAEEWAARQIAKKVPNAKSIDLKLPGEFASMALEKFKNCQNYRLPIILNKKWLLYTLGFRGLESDFEFFFDAFYANEQEKDFAPVDTRMVKRCMQLDKLYDKFMNISGDLVDVSKLCDVSWVEDLSHRFTTKVNAPLVLYGIKKNNEQIDKYKLEEILTFIMNDSSRDLSFEEKEDIGDTLEHAFYLCSICNVLFSMKDNGEDDMCQIDFDALFE